MTVVDVFLEACCAEIERRAALHGETTPELVDGAIAFRRAIGASTPLSVELTTIPLLCELAELDRLDEGARTPLADALLAAVPELPWVPSIRMDDGGTEIGLALLNAIRDLGGVQCGVAMIGAGRAYPLHSHPPQELYLPIVGDGRWLFGGSDDYRKLAAEELVYNKPNDRHGIKAGATPLLAMYVLWP